MKTLRIPLRAVLYKEGGAWIAHCLEFDLLGDGETQAEALRSLGDAIGVQLQACRKYKNPSGLFTPAAGEVFRMFAAGKNVAVGQFEITKVKPGDPVTVEDLQAREYTGAVDSDANPVRA